MNKNELYSDIRKLIDKFCSKNETKEIISYSDKDYSFEGLLEQFNGIVIPIIQRDYAQGRNNFVAKDIRKDFLKDLYNAINNDQPLYLDFIYGNVNSENEFEPLDGQQRLTTLFLLHLYLYKKANMKTEQLEKFSYKTRISSKEFLKTITQKLEIPDGNKTINYKNYIENSSWFLLRWKLDPTVQACLNMLEDIHSLFSELVDNSKIKNLNKITFKLLDIGELNLSDDLYIKMNSRGKSLTDFENLKAQIMDYLKKQKLTNEFSDKLDNEWNDFIWEKIKKHHANKERVDIVHIRIVIAAILKTFSEFLPESGILQSNEHLAKFLNEITNSIGSNNKLLNKIAFDIFKNKEFEEIFANVLDNLNNDKKVKVSSDDYIFSHTLSPYCLYKNLTEIYEQLCNYDEYITDCIKETKINYSNKSLTSINDLILFPENNNKPSYSDYIMFLGQIYYLEAIRNNELCPDDFKEWIRFLRNLTARSYISSSNAKLKSDPFVRDQRYKVPFKLIMKIKDEKSAKPFESFIQQNLNISEDNDEIVKNNKITAFLSHEKKKIEYLRNNRDKANYIYSLENNILFRGNLEFIFSEYIDKNIPLDLGKLDRVMNKCFIGNEIHDDFRMAFLTISNNAYDFIKNHHNCYTFNENWQKVTKYRLYENYADIQWCMSPKENDSEKYILENFKSFFDELIKYYDKEKPLKCIINAFLEKEENKNPNDWRYIFIKQYRDKKLNEDRVPYIVIYNDEDNNEFKASYLRLILPRDDNDFHKII